jgi:hypothetical protein
VVLGTAPQSPAGLAVQVSQRMEMMVRRATLEYQLRLLRDAVTAALEEESGLPESCLGRAIPALMPALMSRSTGVGGDNGTGTILTK